MVWTRTELLFWKNLKIPLDMVANFDKLEKSDQRLSPKNKRSGRDFLSFGPAGLSGSGALPIRV